MDAGTPPSKPNMEQLPIKPGNEKLSPVEHVKAVSGPPPPSPPGQGALKTINPESFNTLLGMPEDYDKRYDRASFWSFFFTSIGRNPKRESSIYYTLIDEERHARFCYGSIEVLMYSCSAFPCLVFIFISWLSPFFVLPMEWRASLASR